MFPWSKRRKVLIIILLCAAAVVIGYILAAQVPVMSCDVAVISANASTDGRPIIWKNFDMSQYWHQQIKYFPASNAAAGGYYLLYHKNDSLLASSSAITPQAGANEAGFSIAVAAVAETNLINGAQNANTHFLQDAVVNCASLTDFDSFIKTWPSSHSGRAISANYVVIDARGGAALYEMYSGAQTSTIKYKRYDANNGKVVDYLGNVITPAQGDSFIGFYVRSNLNSYFPNTSGSERYARSNSLLTGLTARDTSGKTSLSPEKIMRIVSKDVTGKQGSSNSSTKYSTTYCLSRSQTRSGAVIEGVEAGGDPRLTVFWTALGEPSISVYIPTFIGARASASYAYMDTIAADGTMSDKTDTCLLNLAEDSRETYNSLIYSSNRGSATGPYDSTINKNELAKVQQWTFRIEENVVDNTDEFMNVVRATPELITPSNLLAFEEHCAKYVYENYKAGSATAVPWK